MKSFSDIAARHLEQVVLLKLLEDAAFELHKLKINIQGMQLSLNVRSQNHLDILLIAQLFSLYQYTWGKCLDGRIYRKGHHQNLSMRQVVSCNSLLLMTSSTHTYIV